MPLTPYQTAQKNWIQRASQFRAAGIPESSWSQLYFRDMQGVYQGNQPMSNAEIYAGVQSAVRGPQIQDPTRPVSHGGSLFSFLGDIAKNVPSDIGGIITGLEGIPHLIAHLPSEIDNTGRLLGALATGDNSYLHKNGYLASNENLHESWGDFATILQAMNQNGDKQLLPFLPFISDIANMTSGQGRQYLQQHPVTAFLDVLPGVVKAGHLALDSATLESNAAERAAAVDNLIHKGYDSKVAQAAIDRTMPADYTYLYGKPGAARAPDETVPRFFAAGRALQQGNPVKAAVSAAGDLIPVKADKFGRPQTLRQWSGVKASAAGLDRLTREGINRPIGNISDELTTRSRELVKKLFDRTPFLNESPQRQYVLYLGTHLIDPHTGTKFETIDDYNAWVSSLDPNEKADLDTARAIAADQEKQAELRGTRAAIPWSIDPRASARTDYFATNTGIYRAWQKMKKAGEAADEAARSGNGDQLLKRLEQYHVAEAEFTVLRRTTVPEAWQPAVAEILKSSAEKKIRERQAADLITENEAKDLLAQIRSSIWDSDLMRLLGKDEYANMLADAMHWWQHMSAMGAQPLLTYAVDHEAYDSVLTPKIGRLDKPVIPTAFKPGEDHLFVGPHLNSIVQSLTAFDVEVMRQEFVTRLIKDVVIPQFTVSRDKKRMEYMRAIGDAASIGKLRISGSMTLARYAQKMIDEDFELFDPTSYGLRADTLQFPTNNLLITKEAATALRKEMDPQLWFKNKWVQGGTKLYKFAVLTGIRHLVHVGMGGMAFLVARQPLAVSQLFKSARILKSLRDPSSADMAELAKLGLQGRTLSGLRGKVYHMADLHEQWHAQVGVRIGEDWQIDQIHQAKLRGEKIAEYIPNKLAQLEEHIMDMYRVSAFLDGTRSGMDHTAALELAHKVTVDINGMSNMERTAIKQIFPFYAFTRHLFRYLMTYPVDYPLRAAILANIATGYQQDWTSGLPRSYMSLFSLGDMQSAKGNITAFDLKNLNPFRSFANDFSLAGFTSSLTPFLSGALAAAGLDTLSGTTQLYPGTVYNPQTGSLQATPPPGGMISVFEAFVPQVGLLDHYFQISNATKMLARFDKSSYENQLWNMLNMPFHPEVINVPYEKEITEMRRFRQASADVTALEDDPSAAHISKVMEWNLVPWDNELIPPATLAAYYKRVADALRGTHLVGVAPKAVMQAPPKRVAVLRNY